MDRLFIHSPKLPLIIVAAVFLLLVTILSITTGFAQTLSQSSLSHENGATKAAESYKVAKDYYLQLEQDKQIGDNRGNWLGGVRNFRRIYLDRTTGTLAPSCLYMMGRMYYKMFNRFQSRQDLENALGYFKDVSTIFPDNTLADDAIFNVAEIYLHNKKQKQLAANQYLKVVRHYQDGDRYAQALNKIEQMRQDTSVVLPSSYTNSRKSDKLIDVLPVKYWSSADYTRIVIRASAPVHYSSDLLEETTGQPRRLYIDFEQSFIQPQYRLPVPIEDGLLKQVRTGQFTNSTVRVVLDIDSISSYKIFNLNDPFRVVVDVHGNKEKGPIATSEIKKDIHTRPAKKDEKAEKEPAFITLRDYKKIKADSDEQGSLATERYSLAQQLGLGVRKIVIDPGHGGKDPGAIAFGLKEKNISLTISKKIAEVLHSTYGYETALTREKDVFIPLEERTAIANTLNGDLFISIHINAHQDKTVNGIETYYLNLATSAEAMRVAAYENATSTHNISEMQDILSNLMQNSKINESSNLASKVHSKLISGLENNRYQVRDLGVKQAPFYVLIGAEMPAILAEISFITNPTEAKLLADEKYQTTIAQHIAAGIVSYVDNNTTAALR